MTTPYTYLIGWSHLNMYYYGRRTAVGCRPSDLWTSYFTSSQYVKRMRQLHGEPDIITVRKIFSNAHDCAVWENTVLRRLGAARATNFINRTNGDIYFDATGTVAVTVISTGESCSVTVDEFQINRHLYKHHAEGRIHAIVIATGEPITLSTDEFHSHRHLYKHRSEGRPLPPETCAKMSASHKGIKKSEQHKQNIANALRGRKQSPEHLANATKNRNPAKKPVSINGVHYESVSAASQTLGVSVAMLCNRLAGRLSPNAQWWEVCYISNQSTSE